MLSGMHRHPPSGPIRPARLPRIAIGGILHETNTFSPWRTTLPAFAERSLLRGTAMIDAAAGSDSALGGAVTAAAGRADLVPTLFASAMPGGSVTDETFAELAGDLFARLRRAQSGFPRLAGVVLLLHGAMVTGSDPDPEGTLLEKVRGIVGPGCPIAVVLDSNANVSRRMVDAADFLAAYQTYPHLDTSARGREAMEACLAMIEGAPPPVVAFRTLPLLMPLIAQSTAPDAPLGPVLARAAALRAEPGIASLSIVPGFPFSDVPDAGAAVLVHALDRPGGRGLAEEAADDLAALWWASRERFAMAATPLADVPLEPVPGVTVLADIADNPGAGGSSDSTHILHHFLANGVRDAAFATIVDPEAVAACHAAGAGAGIDLAVGGKATVQSGPPVEARWEIEHLGDGVFLNEGRMSHGARNRLGRTATVSTAGISVMLCERRTQALDPSMFRAGGIVPEQCRWLVVKSSVHYRASFAVLATRMIDVECPGLSPSRLQSLDYHRVPRPIVPLDAIPASATSPVNEETLHA